MNSLLIGKIFLTEKKREFSYIYNLTYALLDLLSTPANSFVLVFYRY